VARRQLLLIVVHGLGLLADLRDVLVDVDVEGDAIVLLKVGGLVGLSAEQIAQEH